MNRLSLNACGNLQNAVYVEILIFQTHFWSRCCGYVLVEGISNILFEKNGLIQF